ncbi:hypothetical protein ACUHOO_000775 [Pseudomonas aeruginosa]|jgi:hypothetical protein|uniref:hypothetical protein n=1 Tax=Pseudomonas aeruginosa TaxID=287 RepID=UPI00037CDA4F|nr:hypothetical protein [Pseudomonas aeruginosa]EIU3316475.1 hypothetical protein [Pseudomonas aeruginosa]EIY2512134.1 hypothetical protein [Pseudomonas aeruginosa]EIY2820306.1 hypothetical protein [Pseudomonas aeruginosa]EKT8668864.1 hypothetical protein [Pseudomonas aeruginosa]EKU2957357.1 hypothetical protein [Pseudomonas aeruginosa]
MPYYVDPNAAFAGNQGASTVLGQLSRAQWDDWKARFQPYVDKLANLATSETYAGEQAAQAASSVNASYDNTARGLRMQQQGMGLSLTPAQQAAQDRKLQIGRAAASVDASNNARISARDLQEQIMAGGLGLSGLTKQG